MSGYDPGAILWPLVDAMRLIALLSFAFATASALPLADDSNSRRASHGSMPHMAQLGPRPRYLVDDMPDSSWLKQQLDTCLKDETQEFVAHDFSIGQ